jgi:hypothetical protein
MPETDIGSVQASDVDSLVQDYSVDPQTTDGATGDNEFTWQMADWERWLGYYKKIPELRTAVDAKANWTMGAGFEADEPTKMLLAGVKGHGKDSFNSIILNCIRTYTIGGDAFCEVIRDGDGVLVNLKPLDPSSIKVISNKKGRIIRYEQVTKQTKKTHSFSPDQILHLSRLRLADEIHGISILESVEWIILARNEAMSDWKTVLHRNVSPLQIHTLDTDDSAKIDAYKAKADQARADGENLYIPKGTAEIEVVQSQLNQAASPLAWINQLNDYFYQAVSVPQIIIGNAKEFTDASGKIVYLSFEQAVKGEQLYIEEQVLGQLNIEIHLTFPASLQGDLISSEGKEGELAAAEPNDMTAEMEGPT